MKCEKKTLRYREGDLSGCMVGSCIYEVAGNHICVGINKVMVGVVVIIQLGQSNSW